MTSVGVFTTDRELVVRSWDPWMAEATGVSEPRACGQPLAALFPEVETRGMLPRLRRVAEEGSVEVLAPVFHRYLIACDPRVPSAHFDRMQQHVSISPLRAGGQITGVVVTIEDVTARLDRERTLAAELKSSDEAIRLRAARILAADTAPVAALSEALGDSSWRVRRAAAKGLAQGAGEEAVAALVEAIRERHRDPAVLNAALSALAGTTHDAVPAVIELMRAHDADVRTYAALALGQMEDPRALPALIDALSDADVNVRYHAIEALGRIRGRGAAEALASVAESRDFFLAFPALDALAAIGEPSVAPRLLPLLDDELLQAPAADALGRLGREDVVVPLASLLGRADAPVAAVAGALTTLYDRLESDFGEGELVADLARAHIGAEAGRNLVEALPSVADAELAGMVRVLGWLAADGVDRALARMLAHPAVRATAANSLAARGASAVDALVEALSSDDEDVRRTAASALGRVASPRAVPPLIALIRDSADADTVIVAAGALGAIGDAAAFEPLLELLEHERAAVRQAAVAALNSLGHAELPERTRALLEHPSPRVREAGARIAGYFGFPDSVDALLTLTEDPEEDVRRVAVEQLGLVEEPRARQALVAALGHGTAAVRAAAARALTHLQANDAVPLVTQALADSDQWVRYFAARAAAHHRSASLARALAAIAERDPAPPVRIAAIGALGAIQADESLTVLSRVAVAGDPDLASAALAALGQLRDPAALPVLLGALEDAVPERRLAALDALRQHRVRETVPPVERLALHDPDPSVRAAAVTLLGELGTEESVAALLALLEHPRRVPAAAAALTRVGEAALPWIGRGLSHPDVGTRCAVVEVLARMKHPAASRLLVAALEDPTSPVRLAAAQALGRLDLREAEQKLTVLARTDEHPAVRQAAHDALTR